VESFAQAGWINIVGGCCGTTPAHIQALHERLAQAPVRDPQPLTPALRLSGLEPMTQRPEDLFVNVGERTNVTGSARFKKLILAEDYDAALQVALQQVENGAQIIDINMDEGMLDAEAAMQRFLNLLAAEPDISRVPIMIDSSKWPVIMMGTREMSIMMGTREMSGSGTHHDRQLEVAGDRGGTQMRPGQGRGQLDQPKRRRKRVFSPGPIVATLWRSLRGDGV